MANEEQMNKDMLSALGKLTDALVDSSRMTGASGGGGGSGGSTATSSKNKRLMDEQLRKNYEGLRNWGKSQDAINKLMPSLVVAARKRKKVDGEWVEQAGKYKDAVDKYIHLLNQNASHLDDLSTEVDKLQRIGVFNQQRALTILTKKTNSFTSILAQNQRSASLFNAALITSHSQIEEGTFEYEKFMEDLGKGVKNLDKSILRRANMLDSDTSELRQDLTDADFRGLSLIMGQAQTSITESMSSLNSIGIKSFEELSTSLTNAKAQKKLHEGTLTGKSKEEIAGDSLNVSLGQGIEKLNGALVAMAGSMLTQGIDLGKGFENIVDESQQLSADGLAKLRKAVASEELGGQKLIKKLEEMQSELDKSTKALHDEAMARNDAVKMLGKRFSDPVASAKDKLVAALEGFSIMAALKNLGDKLGAVGKQVSDFNVAQIPATFWSVQGAAIKMGMSFEDTMKFMQENKRTMAIYGDSFSGLTAGMKGTFAKFGYTMQQGAEIVGPAIEAAVASSVNTRDGKALNNFIDQSMNSFKDISGIVNMTAGEYMKLNAELLNSQEVAGAMVGMDQQRAQAYAKDLVALRNNYVQMGLSTQQAQALMQAQQQQQREKVTSRVREAAKGMMLAQQVGMSPEESQRYFQLGMKGNKSVDEQKEYTDIAQRMGSAAEEKRVNAYDQSTSGGMGFDAFLESIKPGGAAGTIIDSGIQRKQAENAKTNMTPEEARAAGDKAQGSKTVADAGQVVNEVSSLLGNVFTKAIWATVVPLGMLALSSGNLARVMGAGSLGEMGKGLMGAAKGGLGSIAGTGATAASSAGKGILGNIGGIKGGAWTVGGAAIGGAALGVGADMLKESGHEKLGGAASIGSSALTGATMGAMFGPWGMAIGAAAGGLYGLSQNMDMFSSKTKDATQAVDDNTKAIENTPVTGIPSDAATPVQSMAAPVSTPVVQSIATPVSTPPPTVAAVGMIAATAAAAGAVAANSDVNKQSSKSTSESGILNVADKDSREQLLAIATSMSTMVTLLQGISSDGLKATVDLPVGSSGFTNSRRIPSAYEYQTGKKTT